MIEIIMNLVERIKNLFHGKFTKQFLVQIYFPFILMVFIGLLTASWLLLEDPGFLDTSISFMGDPIDNPDGWFFWAGSMTFMGVAILPLAPYIRRQLRDRKRILNRIGSTFILIAGIGLIMLGIFVQSEANRPIHLTSATMAFSGLYFGVFFLGFIIIKMENIKKWKRALFCVLGWGGPIGFFITQGIQYFTTGSLGQHGPWILRLHSWEWMLFFFIFATIICIFYIVPERSEE